MTVLIIDGDIPVYQVAAASETVTDWGDGTVTVSTNFDQAKAKINDVFNTYLEKLEADSYVVALSDSTNFRYDVLPTYKHNRQKNRKPELIGELKEYLREGAEVFERPNLEADDVCGILATWKKFRPGEKKIIVTIDKDLKTIPGWQYNVTQQKATVNISEDEADYWHLFQTLTGDTTDGYSGCPMIGPVKAEAILKALPDGPIDPEVTHVEWMWEQVVAAYEKKGLSESAAITQARVARILRASDYNFKTKAPILWTPPKGVA